MRGDYFFAGVINGRGESRNIVFFSDYKITTLGVEKAGVW